MSSPRGCGGRSRGVGESSAKVSGGGGSESVGRGAAAVLRASGCRFSTRGGTAEMHKGQGGPGIVGDEQKARDRSLPGLGSSARFR